MSTTNYSSTPNDSRYIPLTQQPYLCVPACIQIVMYKHNIPLVPQEEIGYHLGLTVPPDAAKSFFKVRVADQPPVNSGYGTQIQTLEYEPNQAFNKLKVPLTFTTRFSSSIQIVNDMMDELRKVEEKNGDALLCFNPGVLYFGEYRPFTGHVVVFDKVIDDSHVRFVDPDAKQPKWRTIESSVLFDAIKAHGDENSGGIWYLSTKD